MPLDDGETFAGYTIVRLLGAGGMGEVYLAQHPRMPRRDTLKVLPTSVSTDSAYRQRFDREGDIATTLWHPHIVGRPRPWRDRNGHRRHRESHGHHRADRRAAAVSRGVAGAVVHAADRTDPANAEKAYAKSNGDMLSACADRLALTR